jgi:hypothetical protein
MPNKVADANGEGRSADSRAPTASKGDGAAAKSMMRHVTLAGLDPDLENRVKAACWRLSAQGYDIRLHAWAGVQSDLLILGGADSHRRVLDAAIARRVPVLRFVGVGEDPVESAHVVAATASVEQILVALHALFDPAAAAPSQHPVFRAGSEKVSGLLWLMVERRPRRGAIHAISESYEVWLIPELAQIRARTHSDLIGARERLLSPKWVFHRVRTGRVPDGPHLHFDEFFLDACMRASHRLPRFPRGNYRLRQRLDTATLESADAEVAALAAQFGGSDGVSTADLGAIADVGQHHANAFLWATLASGALERCRNDDTSAPSSPSLFDRVRARFARAAR